MKNLSKIHIWLSLMLKLLKNFPLLSAEAHMHLNMLIRAFTCSYFCRLFRTLHPLLPLHLCYRHTDKYHKLLDFILLSLTFGLFLMILSTQNIPSVYSFYSFHLAIADVLFSFNSDIPSMSSPFLAHNCNRLCFTYFLP